MPTLKLPFVVLAEEFDSLDTSANPMLPWGIKGVRAFYQKLSDERYPTKGVHQLHRDSPDLAAIITGDDEWVAWRAFMDTFHVAGEEQRMRLATGKVTDDADDSDEEDVEDVHTGQQTKRKINRISRKTPAKKAKVAVINNLKRGRDLYRKWFATTWNAAGGNRQVDVAVDKVGAYPWQFYRDCQWPWPPVSSRFFFFIRGVELS